MLNLLFLAAATALPSGGDTIDRETWIRVTDFPIAAMSKQTALVYEVTFDTSGKAVRCEMALASRNSLANKAICRGLLKRAAVTPLQDAEGRPLFAIMRGSVRMRYGLKEKVSTSERAGPADILQVVDELPAAEDPVNMKILQVLDDTGAIEDCYLRPDSGDDRFKTRACELAKSRTAQVPIRDQNGVAVRGGRFVTVIFTRRMPELPRP